VEWRFREQGNGISEERWSGLSESNRHLNLGKLGKSITIR